MACLTLAACSSAANEPVPHAPRRVPHRTTTTIALLGQQCVDAQGYPYRAERCA